MRLPRNLSGVELASLLARRYGYVLARQRGSHMRLTSNYLGYGTTSRYPATTRSGSER